MPVWKELIRFQGHVVEGQGHTSDDHGSVIISIAHGPLKGVGPEHTQILYFEHWLPTLGHWVNGQG